jgi:osmotically-inducible protein OsmY
MRQGHQDDQPTEVRVVERTDEPTDAEIAQAAAGAFAHTIAVPPGSVTATVHEHVVTLAGTVHSEYQRDAAHRTVAALPGVVGVRDSVALEPTAVVSAQDALSSITAALVRNARLDAEHVHVDVTGSAVTLTGRVSSSHERSEAGQAAWSSPGVTHVHNRLTVAP